MRLKCAIMMAVVTASNSIAATPTETTRAADNQRAMVVLHRTRENFRSGRADAAREHDQRPRPRSRAVFVFEHFHFAT